MRQKSLWLWIFSCVLWGFSAQNALSVPNAAAPDIAICDQAAARAAQGSPVPLSVLQSIARVESGRALKGQFAPWPWTLNVQGKGHFFATKSEAILFANELLAQNIVNFDVGCFQINLRWHARNFTSIEHAFDPMVNAAYAAKFLSSLYQEHGNWSKAVSTYHSRTQTHARAYLKKVKSVWHDLQNIPAAHAPTPSGDAARQVNGYPLLQPSPKAAAFGEALGGLLPQRLSPRISPVLP